MEVALCFLSFKKATTFINACILLLTFNVELFILFIFSFSLSLSLFVYSQQNALLANT